MTLYASLKKRVKDGASSYLLRVRLLNQLDLLAKTKYLKKFKSSVGMRNDPKAFWKAFESAIRPSNIARGAQRAVLHSLVVTLLIGLGDDRRVRKRVGAVFQRKSHNPGVGRIFETFPAVYSHALAGLPPQPRQDTLSLKLLACAGVR